MLGIRGGQVDYQRLSLPAAIGRRRDADLGGDRRDASAASAQMITGQRGTEDLGGPLRIAQLSGQVARAWRRQPGVVHRGAVGQSRADQPVPDPGAGWRAPAVLSGRGDPRPADAAAGAGIRVPRRAGAAGLPVRVRDLERPDASRHVPLGGRPGRQLKSPQPPPPPLLQRLPPRLMLILDRGKKRPAKRSAERRYCHEHPFSPPSCCGGHALAPSFLLLFSIRLQGAWACVGSWAHSSK